MKRWGTPWKDRQARPLAPAFSHLPSLPLYGVFRQVRQAPLSILTKPSRRPLVGVGAVVKPRTVDCNPRFTTKRASCVSRRSLLFWSSVRTTYWTKFLSLVLSSAHCTCPLNTTCHCSQSLVIMELSKRRSNLLPRLRILI